MKTCAVIFAVLSLIFAIAAAAYWWRSSRVAFPQAPQAKDLIRAAYLQEVSAALSTVSRLNAWASILTGVAAILGTVSAVLGTVAA
jgi:hypothetical protein